MRYTLMHKDIPVVDIEIDDNGAIRKMICIHNLDHFPFGTAPKKKTLNPSGLIRWWQNRRIPLSRDDIANLAGAFVPEETSVGALLLISKGLSLSDSYWIKKEGSQATFGSINFYENSFSLDLGDALFGKTITDHPFFMSPDATSEGNLKKRWKIANGKRTLLKSGTPPNHYEVYNEVIASKALAHLGIPHVDYYLVEDGDGVYCACEDFVAYSQDFVTAYMIHEAGGKTNDESEYSFLIRRYKELGIVEAEKAMNQMLLVDYLLGNEDRHLNNFGLLRDAKTLEFYGPAPIFDTGSCLGFELDDSHLANASSRPWKPFATHNKPTQLGYIQTLSGISYEALLSLPSAIASACAGFGAKMSQSRKKAIVSFVQARVGEALKHFGIVSTAFGSGLSKTQERILQHISSIGGRLFRAEDLLQPLGISRITALRNLDVLVQMGKIRRVGARKNGYWELL